MASYPPFFRLSMVDETELNPFRDTILLKLTYPQLIEHVQKSDASETSPLRFAFTKFKQRNCIDTRTITLRIKGEVKERFERERWWFYKLFGGILDRNIDKIYALPKSPTKSPSLLVPFQILKHHIRLIFLWYAIKISYT